MLPESFLKTVRDAIGAAGMVTDMADIAPYVIDWRGRYHGTTGLVVKPANTEEVAAVVKACAAHQIAIVPQGGNTGLVGGSVPHADGLSDGRHEIVLSLARMNRVRSIDPASNTLIAEAGCILANVQQAAERADRLFPLSLAAEGSCTIGGNLATNAGGTNVLRYGNTRDLLLGLEVVLPDGRIWNRLSGLRKDNTGYDLKQLFVGAEGTLGIITAATLKLFPRPHATAVALVAVENPAAAIALLADIRGNTGDRLTGFEIFSRLCLELVLRHMPNSIDPLPGPHPWYVLIELAETQPDADPAAILEKALVAATEAGHVVDATIAANLAQAAALWELRENISEAQRHEGPSIKHDISVAISSVPEFIERADSALKNAFSAVRVVAFGHIGDGNIHYNCAMPSQEVLATQNSAITRVVYDIVTALGGSISAEHGIGQLKREELAQVKPEIEIDLMRAVKNAFDPQNIMNPGKVIPD